MDAKELTVKYYELNNYYYDFRQRIEHLEHENRLLNMHIQDLLVDVKMLQNELKALRQEEGDNA